MAAALLVMGGAAAAQQGPERAVIDQLARQGYVEFEVSRTLLGRIRIVALGPNGERREIVFNPATGEILRDLMTGVGTPEVLHRPAGERDAGSEAGAAVSAAASGGEAADVPNEAGAVAGSGDGAADGEAPDGEAPDGEAPDGEAPDEGGSGEDWDGGDEGGGDEGGESSGEDWDAGDGPQQKTAREDGAAGSRNPGAGSRE
jgi:hypothetical protein